MNQRLRHILITHLEDEIGLGRGEVLLGDRTVTWWRACLNDEVNNGDLLFILEKLQYLNN